MKDDFPEFSVEPGEHRVIPNIRFEDPKQNMETAFAGLREKAHQKGRYFQPIEVGYGGWLAYQTFDKKWLKQELANKK